MTLQQIVYAVMCTKSMPVSLIADRASRKSGRLVTNMQASKALAKLETINLVVRSHTKGYWRRK